MTARPVLVGVDGSIGGTRALRWAAAEAARLRTPLTVCYVVPPVTAGAALVARRRGTEVLADAVGQLRVEWPELPARTVLGEGYPSNELLLRSVGHQLVVMGSRGDSGLVGILLGSVAEHLVAHASCPVVVVPQSRVDPLAPVVVGVDGSELNRPAVEYAFAAAERAGVGLVALSSVDVQPSHGFRHDVPADLIVALAREAIGLWADKLPEVAVRHRVVAGPPTRELVAASAGACLTVVGSRGHGAMTAFLLGSVSHRLVRQALSPVAVVRQLHAE